MNTTPNNPALSPVADEQRVFSGFSHASLWFSLGVGLLVMQVGAYLVPAVGTRDGLLAIVIGSLVGAGLLAWTAKIGCDSGLSSAGLMHSVYGSAFARLPVLLNIVQLVGWTTFELVVMRDGTQAIVRQVTGHPIPVTVGPRRAGDPARLVASSAKIRAELGWHPRHPAVAEMVAAAWTFQQMQGA